MLLVSPFLLVKSELNSVSFCANVVFTQPQLKMDN